ncbi:MAG: sigma-54 dependent transcriptional regulator [Verrucomicrobiota bacterium]
MSEPAPNVLVADDQHDILSAARLLFKGEGIKTTTVSHPDEALNQARKGLYDVALIDLNYRKDTTSGEEGIQLLKKINEVQPELPVVVMTAWATIDVAVEAMRIGAKDFINKPWDNERLLQIVRTQTDLRRSLQREKRLKDENQHLRAQSEVKIIGESPALTQMLDTIRRVAPSDACILITGENGTGKSMIARHIHAQSERHEHPYISVNMGGLPANLFETELFGHTKGAFTDARSDRAGRYELADKGTLFLDEIGNLPAQQQTSLLRLLETGEYERVGSSTTKTADVRIVSATNANLDEKVADGSFRQDLFFRLNTVVIDMPPLRERGNDVLLLANHFLKTYAEKYRRTLTGFSPDAQKLLLEHAWPGNVRELDHAIERAVLMADQGQLEPNHLGVNTTRIDASNLDELSLDEIEKFYIQKALRRANGSANEAAKSLGLSRSAFYRRLQRHGL